MPRWSETAPKGLKSPWYDLWRGCLRTLKDQGTWSDQQKPLLDEYVFAVKRAVEHREAAEADPFREHHESGRVFQHPGFASAERATKLAQSLADQLVLTPAARKRHGLEDLDGDEEQTNPFAGLDELASRRDHRQAS